MSSCLDSYEKTISFLHAERNGYRAKLTSLVEFCNWLTNGVPWKSRDALENMDKDNTHP